MTGVVVRGTAPEGLVSRWAYINGEGKNTEMWVTAQAAAAIDGRGLGLRGVVEDHLTGSIYTVSGHPCGASCVCALRADPTPDATPTA